MDFILNPLPPEHLIETPEVLRRAASAHRRLAELKGMSVIIPNQAILINTLALQEAKDSSAIENIITTQDELFKQDIFPEFTQNAAAKEVHDYSAALRVGFDLVRQYGFIATEHIITIQSELEHNEAGFRKLPGTGLVNQNTGETVYTPPQHHQEILRLMDNLSQFMNESTFYEADALVKMALMHYQFESIHPFYDGNGRTGRILNVLYLVLQGLLDTPILYLSRHIIRTKDDYYRLLQKVRTDNAWEEWVLYMLTAIEQTSLATIRLVDGIEKSMQQYKHQIRRQHKFYSRDLINNLFFHPYTKIEFVERDLRISRITAAKYLNKLAESGLLQKQKIGRGNYFVNVALYELLTAEEKR